MFSAKYDKYLEPNIHWLRFPLRPADEKSRWWGGSPHTAAPGSKYFYECSLLYPEEIDDSAFLQSR